MDSTECPLCWVEAHAGNPGNPEPLTIAEQALIEMIAKEGKRVDVPSVCLEHDDLLKLQEKGLVYTLQPIRHGHLIWWRLTEEGERIARELGFKVKGNPDGKRERIRATTSPPLKCGNYFDIRCIPKTWKGLFFSCKVKNIDKNVVCSDAEIDIKKGTIRFRERSSGDNPGNPDEDLEEVTIVHRLEDNPGNPDGNPGTREIELELAERGIIF